MTWRLHKEFGHWCLVGLVYRTFDSLEEAWDWIDAHLYSEPTA